MIHVAREKIKVKLALDVNEIIDLPPVVALKTINILSM